MDPAKTITKQVDKDHFPVWGIVGSIVGLVFILAGMVLHAESYSWFSFVPADLGTGILLAVVLYRLGAIVAGTAFLPFMIGLYMHLDSRFISSKLAAIAGTLYATMMVSVGGFPTWYSVYSPGGWEYWWYFYLSGVIMTGLLVIAIHFQRTVELDRRLSLIPLGIMAFMAIFPYGGYLHYVGFRIIYDWIGISDDFLSMHMFMWVIHSAIVGCMLTLALYIRREERETQQPPVLYQPTYEWTPIPSQFQTSMN